MKKKITTLLLPLLFSSAISFSQDNLLKGGDFEEPSIETFVYENHTCPVYVPGWDFKAERDLDNLDPNDFNNMYLNKWSVRGEMLYEEAPEDDNYQHIRLQRYEWQSAAGWIEYFGLDQTVAIKPEVNYLLEFDYRINPAQDTTANSEFTEAAGFATVDVPAAVVIMIPDMPDSIIPLTPKLFSEWDMTDINKNWERKQITYKTPANVDQMTIRLAIKSGQVYSWGGNINMWMDIDNVSLVEDASNSIEIENKDQSFGLYVQANGLLITGLEGVNLIEVYNVSGKLVNTLNTSANSLEIPLIEKGLYIVKIGNQSKKIIL